MCTLLEASAQTKFNLDANPGPSFRAEGLQSKLESLSIIHSTCETIISKLKDGVPWQELPTILYGISGRPKLTRKSKAISKLLKGEPVGRWVAMADGYEPLLASMFTLPLYNLWREKRGHIYYAFNKFSDEVESLCKRMDRYPVYLCIDFSRFDSNHSKVLLEKAFQVIEKSLGLKEGCWNTNLLMYLKHHFINSHIVLRDGKIFRKGKGAPSGSGFITAINCIISEFVIHECCSDACKELHLPSDIFDYILLGDNVCVGLDFKVPSANMKGFAGLFLEIVSRIAKRRFGHIIDVTESKIATSWYVEIASPICPQRVRDGSSKFLYEYWRSLERRLQRPLEFDDKYCQVAFEPIPGDKIWSTHRWTYVFFRQAEFCSYFFKRDYTMIRPTFDAVLRILHPERKVRTLDDHRGVLVNCLVDNLNNHHTINHIYHHYMDSYFMEDYNIVRCETARNRFHAAKKRQREAFPDHHEYYTGECGPLPEFYGDRRFFYRRTNCLTRVEDDPVYAEISKRFWVVYGKLKKSYQLSIDSFQGTGLFSFSPYKRKRCSEINFYSSLPITDSSLFSKWVNLKSALYPYSIASATSKSSTSKRPRLITRTRSCAIIRNILTNHKLVLCS
jgi:hypothetical protein